MHVQAKIEKLIVLVSIVLLVQTIVIAFRLNGDFTSHWAVVFIPFFILYSLWVTYNVYITTNNYLKFGHTHSGILILYSWVNSLGCLIFTILLSIELSKPGSIGLFEVFVTPIVMFASNIIILFGYHKIIHSTDENADSLGFGSFHMNYEGRPIPTTRSTDDIVQEVEIQKVE